MRQAEAPPITDAEVPDSEVTPISRERARNSRPRAVRAQTTSVKRMTKRELAVGRALFPTEEHLDVQRPRTRDECKEGFRPCPFVSCANHLYLDVSARTGAIKVNFPDVGADELELLPESCALDVADRHGSTLEEVGAAMNLTRERVRQIEVTGLAKLLATAEMHELRDVVELGVPLPPSRRRVHLPIVTEEDEAEEDEGEPCADDASDPEADFDVEAFASDSLDGE